MCTTTYYSYVTDLIPIPKLSVEWALDRRVRFSHFATNCFIVKTLLFGVWVRLLLRCICPEPRSVHIEMFCSVNTIQQLNNLIKLFSSIRFIRFVLGKQCVCVCVCAQTLFSVVMPDRFQRLKYYSKKKPTWIHSKSNGIDDFENKLGCSLSDYLVKATCVITNNTSWISIDCIIAIMIRQFRAWFREARGGGQAKKEKNEFLDSFWQIEQ